MPMKTETQQTDYPRNLNDIKKFSKRSNQQANHVQQNSKQQYNSYSNEVIQLHQIPFEIHLNNPSNLKQHTVHSVQSTTYLKSMYPDKQLCSGPIAVATFLIIFLIIIAAAIGVTAALVAGKSSSSSGISNGNNGQNTFSTVPVTTFTSNVIIGGQNGLPCTTYTQIDDPTRNANRTGLSSYCDNGALFNTSSGPAWIRFVGSGGTQMPMSSAGINHCGAFLSGWYNDTLPTTVNMIVNGTVCFETPAGICGFSVDVSVVYCPSNFYVYRLPPVTVCNARYCTI